MSAGPGSMRSSFFGHLYSVTWMGPLLRSQPLQLARLRLGVILISVAVLGIVSLFGIDVRSHTLTFTTIICIIAGADK